MPAAAVLAGGPVVLALAPAAAVRGGEPRRAELAQFACHRAANPLNRWISVMAVMRPLPGTERLAVKFELERRAGGARAFTNVHGGDLGRWVHPIAPPTLGQRPGDVWRPIKEVFNLPAGVYRFRVAFRWIGRGGLVLGTRVLRSRLCAEGGWGGGLGG